MKRTAGIICLCAISCFACGYLSISRRDDARAMQLDQSKRKAVYNASVIMGRVSSTGGAPHATMVLAYPLSFSENTLIDYVILDRPGPFMLYVPEGRYHVYSFTDVNGDRVFNEGEVSGSYSAGAGGRPADIAVGEGSVTDDILITAIPSRRGTVTFPRKVRIRDDAMIPHQPGNGDIARIYDEKFCPANADIGWWSPTLFMKVFGARIYITRAFDSGKIPVLFIHGAQGSPQNWAYFLFRLDKTGFQPWFYYYPSGIRLSLASRLLYEALLDLKKKYGFKTICIVAHSMGGLITRDLLTSYDLRKQDITVKLYITLASPWTGFESADRALQLPSKKLPIWYDVASTSAFINQTLQARLPSSVSYYLFYGRGDSVAQGKALDERAYSGAKGKIGFDVDHNTILSDRKVFSQFRAILTRELGR
ncbi:MAG: hypothetical protein A2176_09950 [Spirochaetes bacterium RBG_13_51_14]|nr:MAG: hypothetical protein A2176_09950 [Spirochaetes bacterium RBG_13_51_14]